MSKLISHKASALHIGLKKNDFLVKNNNFRRTDKAGYIGNKPTFISFKRTANKCELRAKLNVWLSFHIYVLTSFSVCLGIIFNFPANNRKKNHYMEIIT